MSSRKLSSPSPLQLPALWRTPYFPLVEPTQRAEVSSLFALAGTADMAILYTLSTPMQRREHSLLGSSHGWHHLGLDLPAAFGPGSLSLNAKATGRANYLGTNARSEKVRFCPCDEKDVG